MALKIIDALKSGFSHDGSFGRAHLIFNRDIDANPLRLSLLNVLEREYLSESFPSKANWTPKRSHFFNATLVSRGGGQTVYLLGPEVSTFVLPETIVEVASEDNMIREEAVWNDVSIDLTWKLPKVPLPAWKPFSPSPPAAPPPSVPPQRVASPPPAPPPSQPPAAPQPVAALQPVAPPPQPAKPPDLPKETPATPVVTAPPSAPKPPIAPKPANWRMWASLAAVAVVAAAGYAFYWGMHNRDYLCDHFHLFCDPEEVAFRDAQTCAAPKTCGASECVAHYRDLYPNGRFSTQIDDIAVAKGRPCGETARVDPEKVAYDRVIACAGSKSCGAPECVTEYRQAFPRGAHRAEVERIATACFDASEKEVYDQAVGCARSRSCGALDCIADYRRRYPNGSYKNQIDAIAQGNNARPCADLVEQDVYDRAVNCARPKSCGADVCLNEYRTRYPNGPHKADIDQIAQSPKGNACPDLDREAFDRAQRCASPLSCGADHCLIEYRRDFGNGKFRAQIDQIAAQKGAPCSTPSPSPSSDLPAFVPIKPGDDPGIRNCSGRNLEPIAQMICKDSDMARANGELQKAFDAKVKSLSDAGGLRNDERAWIERRDRECGIPPSGSWEINDLRKLKNCFLDKTRARINELGQ